MIKLQDFARECGVTDRAIQKHLKTYAAELEGHFERKGPNGTWLDEEACQILRSKMKQLPPAVIDGETLRENDKLKKRVDELETRLSDKERLLALAQQQVQTAQDRVNELQLQAGKVLALEERLEGTKAEQKAKAEEYAHGLAQAAQEAAEAVRAAQAAQELAEAEKKAREAAEAEAADLREELARPLTWKERLFGRKR